MIYSSFSEFSLGLIKKCTDILLDPDVSLRHIDDRYILITKYSSNPKFQGQYLFSSYLNEFTGQCGVAILSNIPYDKENFGQLLPIAEKLCGFYGYNTLMISINDPNYIESFESFGFKKLWKNINIHTGRTIIVFAKNLRLKDDDDYSEEYEYYDEEEEE